MNADATGVATLHTRVTVYVGVSSLCVNADAMGVATLRTRVTVYGCHSMEDKVGQRTRTNYNRQRHIVHKECRHQCDIDM